MLKGRRTHRISYVGGIVMNTVPCRWMDGDIFGGNLGGPGYPIRCVTISQRAIAN